MTSLISATSERETGKEISAPYQSNPQRTLAQELVNVIGMVAALNFARERQWFGVIDQLHTIWPVDPAA